MPSRREISRLLDEMVAEIEQEKGADEEFVEDIEDIITFLEHECKRIQERIQENEKKPRKVHVFELRVKPGLSSIVLRLDGLKDSEFAQAHPRVIRLAEELKKELEK